MIDREKKKVKVDEEEEGVEERDMITKVITTGVYYR